MDIVQEALRGEVVQEAAQHAAQHGANPGGGTEAARFVASYEAPRARAAFEGQRAAFHAQRAFEEEPHYFQGLGEVNKLISKLFRN